MSSVSLRNPSVKPSPKTAHPSSRDYEFHAAPKELSRDKSLSDAGYRLAAVLLNDARFRTGGNASRSPNERLMEETGFDERKLKRVLKELEQLGLIRRAFRKSSQVHRDYIEITWIPSEPKSGEDVISFGVSNLSPQNQEADLACQKRPLSVTESPLWGGESVTPSVSNLSRIKEAKRERISERTATPSPALPSADPSSPKSEDDTGLPDGWNVTLPPERSAEILRDMIGRAAQPPPAATGRSDEGRRPISPGAIRGALQDAHRAGRPPTPKRTRNELLDQVAMLKARRARAEGLSVPEPGSATHKQGPSPAPSRQGRETTGGDGPI